MFRSNRERILLIVLAIIGVVLILNISNALAEPVVLNLGNDAWANNMYDYRTYHESHPLSGLPNNSGSHWIVGLTVFNPAVWEKIDEVNLVADDTIEGMNYHITIENPAIYPWGGQTFHDYSVWINNLVMLPKIGYFQLTADAGEGKPIHFDDGRGVIQEFLLMHLDLDEPLPPVCKIKHMAIKKNGDLKMRFTAPYDARQELDRNLHIRIRIFNEAGTGLDYVDNGSGGNAAEIRIFPPFQILKKDGVTIQAADKVKVDNIPATFAGRTGRIEYRVESDTKVQFRGITYFKLPELEE